MRLLAAATCLVIWPIMTVAAGEKPADGSRDAIITRIGGGHWQHGTMVTGLALSPDGRVAATSGGYYAQVVKCPSGKVLFQLPRCAESPRAMGFNEDGSVLIDGGTRESHVSFWNVAKAELQGEIRIHEKRASAESLALSPDGCTLAVFYQYHLRPGTVDYGIAIFNAGTGRVLFQKDGWPTTTAFHFQRRGDVHDVVLVNRRGKLQRFNIETSELVELDREVNYWPLSTGGGPVRYDTQPYATADGRFSFRLANNSLVVNGRVYGEFRERARQVAVSGNGRWLAIGGARGKVHMWDLESGKRVDPPRLKLTDVWAAYSQDGQYILTTPFSVEKPPPSTVWDAETGDLVKDLSKAPGRFDPPAGPLRVKQEWDTIVVIDCDSDDRELRRFSFLPNEGKAVGMFAPYLSHAVASPDGKLVAASGYFNRHVGLPEKDTGPCVQVYSVSTGRLIARYVEKERFAKSPMIAFSPDGRLLAIAVVDSLRLLDPATGDVVKTLRGHHGAIRSLAFSPSGHRLVTAADDNTCIIWRVPMW